MTIAAAQPGRSAAESGTTEAASGRGAFAVHDTRATVQAVNRFEDIRQGARAFAEKRPPKW